MSKKVLESIATESAPGVFVVKDVIAKPNLAIVDGLKSHANENPQQKSRLLLHQNIKDSLHQMLIVHSKGQYIRPHINTVSAKSWQVVEGKLALLYFSDSGELIDHVFMSSITDGDAFMVRLSESFFHTLIPITNKTVIVETILGPFTGTTYASWAPIEEDTNAADSYVKHYCQKIGIVF